MNDALATGVPMFCWTSGGSANHKIPSSKVDVDLRLLADTTGWPVTARLKTRLSTASASHMIYAELNINDFTESGRAVRLACDGKHHKRPVRVQRVGATP